MKPVEVGQFLVADPRVCHGRLTFKGTRLPVETILNWLAKGKSVESILADWPYVTREAISEAIQLASAALTDRYLTKTRPKRNGSIHLGRATRGSRTSRASTKKA